MALSTIDDDGGPWTSPVQYERDSHLDLYFALMPDARHVRNIQRDARVAVAIYHMPDPLCGDLGLQIRGVATALAPGRGNDTDIIDHVKAKRCEPVWSRVAGTERRLPFSRVRGALRLRVSVKA